MYGNYTREATKEEVKNYKIIEALTDNFNSEEFENFTNIIGDYVFSYGAERKSNYNRVYRLAKKYNTTVSMLENWYCID